MSLTSRWSSAFGAVRVALVGLFVFCLAVPGALAASVTHNANFSFPLSPGNQVLSLPQWDPALYPGQVLAKVGLKIVGDIEATLVA